MKGFSDEERDRIREHLVESARDLLRVLGPKKTNVEDITEPVGIAKSTFYRFFDSKADLYLEIIERESEEMRLEIEAEIEDAADTPEALARFIRAIVSFSETNPLVQYREEFLGSLSPEKIREMGRDQFAEYIPLIEALQIEAGSPFADHDPEMVLGVVGAAEYLALHQQEYDTYRENYYEDVKDVLTTVLVRGLTGEAPE